MTSLRLVETETFTTISDAKPCNSDSATIRLEEESFSQSTRCATAEKMFMEKTANSKLFDNTHDIAISFPKFREQDLELWQVLGTGGFCTVREITKISLDEETDSSEEYKQNCADNEGDHIGFFMGQEGLIESYHNRQKIKEKRYVIKKVKVAYSDDESDLLNAIIDLAYEAKLLSSLEPHPHIIKLRAMSSGSFYDMNTFFLVFDKLYETLKHRLIRWKRQKMKHGFLRKIMDRGGRKERCFWTERCSYALDLADALSFLHESNVMHRDIKPDNIGFDIRGKIKLFDFGLAREFDSSQRDENGLYQLTECIGSPRYIDPQIALGKPYNELCDVYSFCILLWQILQLETPYAGFTWCLFLKRVAEDGYRPKVCSTWPLEIQQMMRSGWGEDYNNRPTMKEIGYTLRLKSSSNDLAITKNK